MNIVVINKDRLENIPPLISVIYHLNDLGYNVHVITTGCGENALRYFDDNNIGYNIIPDYKGGSVVGKVIGYLKYRRKVAHLLKQLSFDCLWVEGGNTILALGSVLLNHKFILQVSELYENSPRMFKAINKVIHKASAVVMPEYNRTVLYQVWFGLKKRPYVLPNIPAFMPSSDELVKLEDKYNEKLKLLTNKIVVLYQGHIGAGRDLTFVAKAVQELGDNYVLLLLGKDHNTVHKLKELCNNIVFIDFIPAPEYLVFTKNSTIGILSYDPTSINNVYCAPNKLFEYAAYGLPMLGNDIPGLKYSLEYYGAGEIMDETNVESIKNAILKIKNNVDSYIENSRKLFTSFDNQAIIQSIIDSVNTNEDAPAN